MSIVDVPHGWEVFSLGDLFDFSNGVNADKSAYGEGVSFANVLEVITHEALIDKLIPGRITLPSALVARYQVRHGDVLFNRTSETQDEVGLTSVYVGNSTVVFGGFVFRGRPKMKRLDVDYSKYALRAHAVREQIVARGQGGIRANIGQRDLKTVRVVLPPPDEQRLLARILSDAGHLIATLEQLTAKQEAIKRGIMQKLLSGETRLPGFDGPWAERTLGGIARVTMGQSPPSASYNAARVGLPLVQGNADIRGRRSIARLWTTAPTKTCDAKDLLLTVRAPVGFTAVASSASCLGRGVCALQPKGSNRYLFHALVYAEAQWTIYEQGSTFTAVNSDQVRAFMISLPDDAAEQAAIAAVLDDAEAGIRMLRERLAKARAIKQGLMQELVSGRTRLAPAEAAT